MDDTWSSTSISVLSASYFFCIIWSIISTLSSGMLDTKSIKKPNQAVWSSAYNSMLFCYIIGISFGIGTACFFGPLFGLIFGFVSGLYACLVGGGLGFIGHFILRILLLHKKNIPRNYPRFLDYATECLLLRKVGGGYIFIHRLFMEYFASLSLSQSQSATVQVQPDAYSSPATELKS
jgi:eukaryotic-like serine/threonine-protein kinase